MLVTAYLAARRASDGRRAEFLVLRVPTEGLGIEPRPLRLVLHVGPGDEAEPVATVLLPGED